MIAIDPRETLKRARYVANFLRRRLVHVNLQLLYRCNMRCRICDFWRDGRDGEPELTLAQVAEISTRLARIGPQIVSIGGGEPLLHRDIVGVVRALARHHLPVMITNGWYVTKELARELFAAGACEISVSVDYADAARHDAQRGVAGAHARAMEALEILHASRARPDQRVHMISVIMDDNLDDVEPLLERCRAMGITYLVTLYSDGRGAKASRLVPAGVSGRLADLKRRSPSSSCCAATWSGSRSRCAAAASGLPRRADLQRRQPRPRGALHRPHGRPGREHLCRRPARDRAAPPAEARREPLPRLLDQLPGLDRDAALRRPPRREPPRLLAHDPPLPLKAGAIS